MTKLTTNQPDTDKHPQTPPDCATSIPEVEFPPKEWLITNELANLRNSHFFSIYTVDSILRNVDKALRGPRADDAYRALETLNHVAYKDMPKIIVDSLPTYLSCTTGLPIEKFEGIGLRDLSPKVGKKVLAFFLGVLGVIVLGSATGAAISLLLIRSGAI